MRRAAAKVMARVLERSYLLLAVCVAFALALDDKATDFGKGKSK